MEDSLDKASIYPSDSHRVPATNTSTPKKLVLLKRNSTHAYPARRMNQPDSTAKPDDSISVNASSSSCSSNSSNGPSALLTSSSSPAISSTTDGPSTNYTGSQDESDISNKITKTLEERTREYHEVRARIFGTNLSSSTSLAPPSSSYVSNLRASNSQSTAIQQLTDRMDPAYIRNHGLRPPQPPPPPTQPPSSSTPVPYYNRQAIGYAQISGNVIDIMEGSSVQGMPLTQHSTNNTLQTSPMQLPMQPSVMISPSRPVMMLTNAPAYYHNAIPRNPQISNMNNLSNISNINNINIINNINNNCMYTCMYNTAGVGEVPPPPPLSTDELSSNSSLAISTPVAPPPPPPPADLNHSSSSNNFSSNINSNAIISSCAYNAPALLPGAGNFSNGIDAYDNNCFSNSNNTHTNIISYNNNINNKLNNINYIMNNNLNNSSLNNTGILGSSKINNNNNNNNSSNNNNYNNNYYNNNSIISNDMRKPNIADTGIIEESEEDGILRKKRNRRKQNENDPDFDRDISRFERRFDKTFLDAKEPPHTEYNKVQTYDSEFPPL